MAKPCCETGDPKPTPSWKVWIKRAWYIALAIIVIIIIWSQIQVNS